MPYIHIWVLAPHSSKKLVSKPLTQWKLSEERRPGTSYCLCFRGTPLALLHSSRHHNCISHTCKKDHDPLLPHGWSQSHGRCLLLEGTSPDDSIMPNPSPLHINQTVLIWLWCTKYLILSHNPANGVHLVSS